MPSPVTLCRCNLKAFSILECIIYILYFYKQLLLADDYPFSFAHMSWTARHSIASSLACLCSAQPIGRKDIEDI